MGVHDLTSLELTDESLTPKTALRLPSSLKFLDFMTGQTLMIVSTESY